jgi:hypothetical protein
MYLILPVQRIPRYELLLGELLKLTPKFHVDYDNLSKARAAFASLGEYMNTEKRRFENAELLREIQLKYKNMPVRYHH